MWQVTWPKPGKGRNRQFFTNVIEADAFLEDKKTALENFGRQGMSLTDGQRIMFLECTEELKPFGRTIRDATKHFVEHLKATEKSCTAEQLVTELIEAKKKDGASDVHLKDLRRLDRFANHFDGQSVASITSAQIDDWLRGLTDVAPATRNHYRRLLVLAFSFAGRRGYVTGNPAKETDTAREPKTKPGILSVEQATALVASAPPEILPYIAIGLFAGLRRAEIERLDWSEIHFDSGLIEVTAEKSKSKRANRFITIQPNLREWLLPFRKLKGNVTPQENFRDLFEQSRLAAGIKDWPNNALRHSFASYHAAHFKDPKGLALEMEHSDSGMLFNHYRTLVKPADACDYWQIAPHDLA